MPYELFSCESGWGIFSDPFPLYYEQRYAPNRQRWKYIEDNWVEPMECQRQLENWSNWLASARLRCVNKHLKLLHCSHLKLTSNMDKLRVLLIYSQNPGITAGRRVIGKLCTGFSSFCQLVIPKDAAMCQHSMCRRRENPEGPSGTPMTTMDWTGPWGGFSLGFQPP